ncbi:NTPase [Persephonella sp.]|uniref:NTPase n=1 Tax=Persephonella sp. TaxID=2060922 RepID=UPI002602260C|nr:NTPase [Persephonella sp.]
MKILITGKPGIGKTTIIKKLASYLKDRAIGFYTEEIRDKTGHRKGFVIKTLDGKEGILALKGLASRYKVSKYGVNIEEFESIAIPVLEKALKENKIILIDEIGKMELFSEKFTQLIKQLFEDKNKTIIATIPIKNVHPVIKWIKSLPDAQIIEIDYTNRDYIPEKILESINER